MIIPAKFKIFNQTIKVVYKRTLVEDKGFLGLWDQNRNTIYLQQSTRKCILTKDQIEQTFLHELFHCIFSILSYPHLSNNEALVDRLGMVMHQVLEQITND